MLSEFTFYLENERVKMDFEFSIGENSTRRISKKEMIDLINKTFPEKHGCIAVITETKARIDFNNTVKMQTVTLVNHWRDNN